MSDEQIDARLQHYKIIKGTKVGDQTSLDSLNEYVEKLEKRLDAALAIHINDHFFSGGNFITANVPLTITGTIKLVEE